MAPTDPLAALVAAVVAADQRTARIAPNDRSFDAGHAVGVARGLRQALDILRGGNGA